MIHFQSGPRIIWPNCTGVDSILGQRVKWSRDFSQEESIQAPQSWPSLGLNCWTLCAPHAPGHRLTSLTWLEEYQCRAEWVWVGVSGAEAVNPSKQQQMLKAQRLSAAFYLKYLISTLQRDNQVTGMSTGSDRATGLTAVALSGLIHISSRFSPFACRLPQDCHVVCSMISVNHGIRLKLVLHFRPNHYAK